MLFARIDIVLKNYNLLNVITQGQIISDHIKQIIILKDSVNSGKQHVPVFSH